MIDAHIEYQGEYSYEHLMEYVQAAILIPVRKNGMIV